MTLQGWQRTWLGAAEAVEVAFASSQVRNAARLGAKVRFEVRIGRRWRNVEFSLRDETSAADLLSILPATRTAGFDEEWVGLQEFNRLAAMQAGRQWVTPAIVLLNVIAFIAIVVRSGGNLVDPQEMARWTNAGLITTRGEWWRLLSAAFLHWNLAHLALNMWALWNSGRLTERLYGSRSYLGLYLASAVLSSLASIAWNPAVVSAGASGAVFGVLGALLARMMRDHGLPRVVVKAHRWSTLTFVLLNLAIGAASVNTDNAAHVGGLVVGFVLGWLLARPIDVERRASLSPRQAAVSVGIVVLTLALGLHAVRGPAPDDASPYLWMKRNAWYVEGEVEHFRVATQLDWQLNSGQISPAEYAAAIRRQLLPFLQQAVSHIDRDSKGAAGSDTSGYATLVRRFVQVRSNWLDAVAASIEDSSDDNAAKAARLEEEFNHLQSQLNIAQLRDQFDGRPMGVRAWLLDAYWTRKLVDPANCVLPPDVLRRVADVTDSSTDGPALRRDAGCAAQRSFVRRDFATLDRRIAKARLKLDDLPDGSSTYAGLLYGIGHLGEFGRMPPELLLHRFAEWRRASGPSPVPDLLQANLHLDSAWAARGHGYAKEVRAQDWALFRYRVGLARAIVDETADRSHDQPFWYTTSINVGLDGNEDVATLRATFDEGARRFPTYQPLYEAMLRVLMPRWRGSTEQVADFIEQQSFTRPDSVYARLYAAYADMEGDDVDVFSSERVSWQRIRAGFATLRSRYSSSDYIANTYAWMACRKGDAEAYAQVRGAALKHPSWTAWSGKFTLSTCDERLVGHDAPPEVLAIAPVGGSVDSKGNVLTASDEQWVRRQTDMALAAAEPVRSAITRYVEEHDALPSDDVLRQEAEFRTVNPMGAVVEIGLGASINMKLSGGPLDGRKFSWTPYLTDHDVRWQCAQETIPEEYLGAPCR